MISCIMFWPSISWFSMNYNHWALSSPVHPLTIFGFAGAVVWLQEIALHTAAGVAAFSVCACLTACSIHTTLIEIYTKKHKSALTHTVNDETLR